MRLTVVGCSGSFPGPWSAASCYLVEHDGFRLVVDLGSGAVGPLQSAVSLDAVDAVVVSHLHADHYLDLCPLFVARRYSPEGQPVVPLVVYAPAGAREQVARSYGCSPQQLDRVFRFEVVRPGRLGIGPFDVTATRTAHPVECHALRLEAGGASLLYTGDTGPSADVTAAAAGVDVLLGEASYVDGDDNPPDLHLTGGDLGLIARDAGVGRLVVTHVPPWNDRSAALASAVGSYGGPAVLAEPGAVHEV